VDADGDGQPEQWHTFQDSQLQEIALDTNHDGRPDQWHHYHPSGELAFIEVGSTATGKVDQWHRYRDGALHLVEHDTDGNGAVDRIIITRTRGKSHKSGKI
jgi:hypothetical protein